MKGFLFALFGSIMTVFFIITGIIGFIQAAGSTEELDIKNMIQILYIVMFFGMSALILFAIAIYNTIPEKNPG